MGPDYHIPDVPAGEVRLEQVRSVARQRDVDLFTAVPHGYGAGADLPVCLVLHGASTRPKSFRQYGLPQLLTSAVRNGASPFVLAGADGGELGWDASSEDDPARMLTEELPRWLGERGFDVGRVAAWGWSLGGHGAFRHAELDPGWLRAVAAFSPAVRAGDAVFADVEALANTPIGIWCGTEDPLLDDTKALVAALPERPEIVSYGAGEHTMVYWTGVAEDAFQFIGKHLRE